jgi:hypothetical protein
MPEPNIDEVVCSKDCPIHSPSEEATCAYNIAFLYGTHGEPVTYGEPCKHPDAFEPFYVDFSTHREPEGE